MNKGGGLNKSKDIESRSYGLVPARSILRGKRDQLVHFMLSKLRERPEGHILSSKVLKLLSPDSQSICFLILLSLKLPAEEEERSGTQT